MVERADPHVLLLLRRRDSRGLEMAYDSYAARVRSFLYRMTRRDDLADDLLQQTFLKLAEKGPELRPDSDLRAWLFTVARNAFYDSQRSQTEVSLTDEHLEVVSSYTSETEAQLMLGNVELALNRLKPEDREILLLVGTEELSHETVATLLRIQPATMRQRLSRARARLLAALETLQTPLDVPDERTSA